MGRNPKCQRPMSSQYGRLQNPGNQPINYTESRTCGSHGRSRGPLPSEKENIRPCPGSLQSLHNRRLRIHSNVENRRCHSETMLERFDPDAKSSIVRQLDGFIQQWRQIEGPLFGSIDGGPCEDVLFQHSWDATPRRYGPFLTRKGFNQGVVEASLRQTQCAAHEER